jgi:hypothetical protein
MTLALRSVYFKDSAAILTAAVIGVLPLGLSALTALM